MYLYCGRNDHDAIKIRTRCTRIKRLILNHIDHRTNQHFFPHFPVDPAPATTSDFFSRFTEELGSYFYELHLLIPRLQLAFLPQKQINLDLSVKILESINASIHISCEFNFVFIASFGKKHICVSIFLQNCIQFDRGFLRSTERLFQIKLS